MRSCLPDQSPVLRPMFSLIRRIPHAWRRREHAAAPRCAIPVPPSDLIFGNLATPAPTRRSTYESLKNLPRCPQPISTPRIPIQEHRLSPRPSGRPALCPAQKTRRLNGSILFPTPLQFPRTTSRGTFPRISTLGLSQQIAHRRTPVEAYRSPFNSGSRALRSDLAPLPQKTSEPLPRRKHVGGIPPPERQLSIHRTRTSHAPASKPKAHPVPVR